ncbi:nuclear transport factor 2 family protein (plasmid) [Cedecea neteri]|uniref:nuclear transport factor 2 family protein n=1 Tax=Cedecea neteri TaxID=158822 RepID=UPI00289377EE|nr:nuclear transport factor 2 family protein [Cedecea neteri]WNJ82178.1 nuclear transport factor 2 family protein [Cedecea neteri]
MQNYSDNKAIVRGMWEAYTNNDKEVFYAAMADDIKFTVMGTTRLSMVVHGKQEMADKIITPLTAAIEDGHKVVLDQFIGEGDWVVMLSRGFAVGKNGQPYNQHYAQIFRLEEGLVTEWTEYLDTGMLERILED